MERTDLFVCKCCDVSHQLILSTMETEENEKRIVYAAFHLDNYGFWNRMKNAVKYVLGVNRKDSDFDCFLLNTEDMDRLKLFADYLSPNSKDIHQMSVKKETEKFRDEQSASPSRRLLSEKKTSMLQRIAFW